MAASPLRPASAVPSGTAARSLLALFAAASLAAVLAGALTLSAAGLGTLAALHNPAAWAVGAILAAALLIAGGRPALARIVPWLAAAALAATFLFETRQGVHRWVDLGPLHINSAALFLPTAVVAIALTGIGRRSGFAAAASMALLVLQPDPSQATAFAGAMAVLLVRSDLSGRVTSAGLAATALAVGAAWLRPDPLLPLAEVEEIFSLALAISVPLAAAGAVALALASLAPLAGLRTSDDHGRDAAVALAVQFAVVAAAPLLGAFPVPLVGLGMSFPVGHWLAVGLLCGRMHRR